jgi:hypothetical protein
MLTVLSYNCNNNCSNCGLRKTNINNMNICGACSRSGSCKKAKCYKCPDFSRSPVIQGQAYYDDQGGSAIIQSQYCQKVYDVYMNIEKNIEIYKKDGDA